MIIATAAAIEKDIPSPSDKTYEKFGHSVTVLPNGNFVVTDPQYRPNEGAPYNVGAVYLYDPAGNLISTLTGTQENDLVGRDGVVVLANGNYVICSRTWRNGTDLGAGAVTWGHQDIGVSGVVSPENSLVGGSEEDFIGERNSITPLLNGNYVIASPSWSNSQGQAVGAVTWANGTTGLSGYISASNSLLGSHDNEFLGVDPIVPLTNGNYVVVHSRGRNSTGQITGSVAFGNGSTGTVGIISEENALTGNMAGENVGGLLVDPRHAVVPLVNGNYVVATTRWSYGRGAVTWVDGTVGLSGRIGEWNSLTGSRPWMYLGGWVTALRNGHYVVSTPTWSDDDSIDTWGAVTWCDGTKPSGGSINRSNSWVGVNGSHGIGSHGTVALEDGNFVIVSPYYGAFSGANGAVT